MQQSREQWLREARRYAYHIYCYEELVDDCIHLFEAAYDLGTDVYEFVEYMGDKYDLDRADQSWGIHQGVAFEKTL